MSEANLENDGTKTQNKPELDQIKSDMKSAVDLKHFVDYCHDHPGERFWQALRNWSNADAIFKQVRAGQGIRVIYDEMPIYIKDTFED